MRIQHFPLAERLAGADLHLPFHHERLGEVQAGDQYLVHKNLLAFGYFVSEVDLVGIAGLRLGGILKLHVGKPAVGISVHHLGLVVNHG